eukprot:COSAG02_NODE_10746_length_1866_cov_2.105829_2_plen_153_part_00
MRGRRGSFRDWWRSRVIPLFLFSFVVRSALNLDSYRDETLPYAHFLANIHGFCTTFRWGSGAHAPPVPVDMRKPDELGLSVAEGGRCDRSGRCMCAAGFMPSPEVIATLLLVLSIVTAVSFSRSVLTLRTIQLSLRLNAFNHIIIRFVGICC